MKRPAAADVDTHIPVRPAAFAVLAALAGGPLPGIAILDAVNATVARPRLFGPGTLYRLMRDMRAEGLIARVEQRGESRDERRSDHALTPLGRDVLRAETARLRHTLRLAGAAGR